MTWTVYTFFDEAGEVIYVGHTRDFEVRQLQHVYKAPWFHEAKSARRVEFQTEREARDAEYSIIAAEQPRHNYRGTDLCPRCLAAPRAQDRRAPYCLPCQREYQTARRRAAGMKPKVPTVTCPQCGGIKEAGRAYCLPCKRQVSKEARARAKQAPA